MSVRIELRERPNVLLFPASPPETGITAIEVDDDGRTLTVVGWFDQFAKWDATVELSDEQADELREGLRR
jgi:hypothetical protein